MIAQKQGIDKHGLKINGLKSTSGKTLNYGYYSGHYVEIFYDKSNGDVWGIEQYCLGQNTWTVYHNKDVIKICNASVHMTMQEIADAIYETVTYKQNHIW